MRLTVNTSQVKVNLGSTQIRLQPHGPPVKVKIEESQLKLTMGQVEAIVIKVAIGMPGPAGERGDPGPQGPPGLDALGEAIDFAANCLPTDGVDHLVYVTGDEVFGKMQVAKVDIDDVLKMPAVGIIISKTSPTDCVVRRFGEVSKSGLTPNGKYFIGTDSKPLLGPPPRPGSGRRSVQKVGVAKSSGTLWLFISLDVVRILPS